MKLIKLFISALVAWAVGIGFVAAILYFKNGGVDFTITDIMGFGMLAIVASGLLMLILYLPSLYWLKRRRGGTQRPLAFLLLTGLLCNLPVFIIFPTLINRHMLRTEALFFMATFLIIGSVFGLGFTWVEREPGNPKDYA